MAIDEPTRTDATHRAFGGALVPSLLLVASVIALAWFATTVSLVLVLTFSAVVIATALNGPVSWMEQRRVPRVAGTLGIVLAAFLVATGVGVLVGTTLVEQVASLVEDVPEYIDSIEDRSDEVFGEYPALDDAFEPVREDSATRQVGPAVQELVTRIGRASLGAATLAVAFITWLTMVVYLCIEPRSPLRMLLCVSPVDERDSVERVVVRFSGVVRSWLWANVAVGATEAVAVALFLSWIDIPAALVWGLLAFFAVFIPKIGAFIMATPPIIVAVAVDPSDVIWIAIFYVVMTEIMSDVVLPRIQGEAMDLHPVFLVVFVLVFGSSFGLLGAVVATPLAGLVAAAWDEFVVSRRPAVENLDARVERMLVTSRVE